MVLAMSNRLQNVTETFGRSQGDYLKAVEKREAKTKELFGDFDLVTLEDDSGVTSLQMEPSMTRGQISTQDLLQLEEDTKHLEQREKEINEIVKSISELNTIFKDLAHMVSEQVFILINHKLLIKYSYKQVSILCLNYYFSNNSRVFPNIFEN